MLDRLPETFSLVLRDDSMSPEAKVGALAWFQTGLEPRPNDWVLVVDDAGAWYMREYSERRPGHWIARALNAGYEPLDSKADGLQVAAICMGVYGRRGT